MVFKKVLIVRKKKREEERSFSLSTVFLSLRHYLQVLLRGKWGSQGDAGGGRVAYAEQAELNIHNAFGGPKGGWKPGNFAAHYYGGYQGCQDRLWLGGAR